MTTTTSITSLNALEAAYVASMNNHDPSALAVCFKNDAIVEDEGKIHLGHDAIIAWSTTAFKTYHPHLEVTHVGVSNHHTVISGLVSGSFDGSPVELHHYLHIHDGKIKHLKITT